MLEIKDNLKIENIYAAGVFQDEKPTEFLNGFNDRVEAVFVLSGKLTVAAETNIYECNAGTAAIFAPGEIHYISLSQKEYTEYLLVSFSASGEDLSYLNSVTALSVLQKQLVLSICNQISADNEYNVLLPSVFEDEFASSKLAATLELLALEISSNKTAISPFKKRDALLFEQAVAEMQNNVLSKLSLEELAGELEISLSHLKRIFASFTDVGAHEYFMVLKIRKAIELLQSGHSVTETAKLTGFNNQNYFSAAFKRITGAQAKDYCSVKKRKATRKTENITKPTRTVKANSAPAPAKKPSSDMPNYLL